MTATTLKPPATDIDGYTARPTGTGPWPGVVLLHEFLGVDDTIRGLADRLAAAGYLTVAPHLFSPVAPRDFADAIAAIVTGKGTTRSRIEDARQWLLDAEDCTGRLGLVGLSMGGSLALRCLADGYDAASVIYPVQLFSLDDVLGDACPVAVSFGGTDPTAIGAVDRFDRALTERGVPHDVKGYPRAGHSFLNASFDRLVPLRPLFRLLHQGPQQAAGEDTWARTEAFLAEHLG